MKAASARAGGRNVRAVERMGKQSFWLFKRWPGGYDGPRDYLDIKSILVRFRSYKDTLLLSFEKMRI